MSKLSINAIESYCLRDFLLNYRYKIFKNHLQHRIVSITHARQCAIWFKIHISHDDMPINSIKSEYFELLRQLFKNKASISKSQIWWNVLIDTNSYWMMSEIPYIQTFQSRIQVYQNTKMALLSGVSDDGIRKNTVTIIVFLRCSGSCSN